MSRNNNDEHLQHFEEKFVLCGSAREYYRDAKRPLFICPPFDISRYEYKHTKSWACVPKWLVKWLLPALLAGFGFFLQNWQLRYGTYYYVHVMVQRDLDMNETRNRYKQADSIPLTFGETSKSLSFGSLEDPVVGEMGSYQNVSISTLDAIALLFPILFIVLTVAVDNVFVWTKIMICFSVLAFFKGLFSWITIVPDSNGWQVCKARLGASKYSVDWFMEERSAVDILLMDPRSRLCADMMYSGHTYFVTLFAFGLHETTRLALRTVLAKWRILFEALVGAAFVIQQSVEVYFVLKSRFHYTSDVVMAFLLTYLFYTNIAIATLAGWWVYLNEDELQKYQTAVFTDYDQEYGAKAQYINAFSRPNAMTSLGCCWCSWTQQYTYSRQRLFHIMNKVQESESALRREDSCINMDINAKVRIREELGMLHARSIWAHSDKEEQSLQTELKELQDYGRMFHQSPMYHHSPILLQSDSGGEDYPTPKIK